MNCKGDMMGLVAIGLNNIKSDYNLGGAMRAAQCYGAGMVAYTGKRVKPGSTDTGKSSRHIPLIHGSNLRDLIPHGCVPVAVDVVEGATSLIEYKHPKSAFYIFGAEDATLGKSTLEWCRDRVYVPTHRCMNLAACVNVVLYDRMAKLDRAMDEIKDEPASIDLTKIEPLSKHEIAEIVKRHKTDPPFHSTLGPYAKALLPIKTIDEIGW